MSLHTDYDEHERYRRIITLFANAPAPPLIDYDKLALIAKKQKCCAPVNYPEQVSRSIGNLYNVWEDWNQGGKDRFTIPKKLIVRLNTTGGFFLGVDVIWRIRDE